MSLRWLKVRRWYAGLRDLEPPFAEFVAVPVPAPGSTFRDVEFLSLDIETTGLDAATAEMLSVGWVVVRNGKVDLATAESYIVRPGRDVGSSASVHGLTDTLVEAGQEWGIVLCRIVAALTGRALLVHHAGLDKALLDRLCRQRFNMPLLVPVVDTLALEHRRQRRRHHVDAKRSLRLSDLRKDYGLPRYGAHDCLVDAIAAAELLLAMVAHNDGADQTLLRDLCA